MAADPSGPVANGIQGSSCGQKPCVRPARLQCENSVDFLVFCCSGGCSGDDRAFAAKAMILMDECRVDICTVGNLAMAVFCLRFMM